jgi:hypothetical protein
MIDTNGIETLLKARDAAIGYLESSYRMAGFPRPFAGPAGERFYHLFAPGENLALCKGLAVVRVQRLQPARLYEIDCLACLDAFTERYRGRSVA